MSRIEFLKPEDIVTAIEHIFSKNPKNVRMPLSLEKIHQLGESYKDKVLSNTGCVVAVLQNGEPQGLYAAIEYPEVGAWRVAGTAIAEYTNHYAKSAEILAPALDALIQRMENKMYFKWWMIAPEQHHNIRNRIMKRYSQMLGRYTWYDELVIPPNTTETGIPGFDNFREIIDWSSAVARMFVLDQKHRVEILRQSNHPDYQGTILE
jgi:hypothetical protein